MTKSVTIGRRLIPLEHIALIEPFDTASQTRLDTERAFQTTPRRGGHSQHPVQYQVSSTFLELDKPDRHCCAQTPATPRMRS